MPILARAWIGLLAVLNGAVPLFFLPSTEAIVTLVAFFAGALLMMAITSKVGFARLLGIGHFLWFPLLAFLWTRLDLYPASTPGGIWIRTLIAANAVSLLIDVTDVV